MTKVKVINKCLDCQHYNVKDDTCDMKKEGVPVVTNPSTYFNHCSNWKV